MHIVDAKGEFLDLIQRAKDGESKASDAMARLYRPLIESVVRAELGARLKARVEVEDVVQEAFLRAFRSFRRFRGDTESALRGWLAAVAKRVVQGEGRRAGASKRRARGGPLDAEVRAGGDRSAALIANLAGDEASPSQVLRRNERFERLKKALDSLSPDHRKVIILARVKGLPMKEVARRMGRGGDARATSVLLWRAMQALKAAFGTTDSFRLPPRSLDDDDGDDDGDENAG